MTSVASTDPVARRSNINQRDRWNEQRFIVQQVGGAYAQLSDLPALAARTYDPNPESRSLTRTASSAEFAADVENAVRYAVRNQPDAVALIKAWHRLCLDPNTIGEVESRFIKLAGPIFIARGLHPRQYFVRTRRKVGEKLK